MKEKPKPLNGGICCFSRGFRCEIIVDTKCNGCDTACSFYKTDKQYTEALDRAIRMNRRKGNCKKCKYVSSPCKCSGENYGIYDL